MAWGTDRLRTSLLTPALVFFLTASAWFRLQGGALPVNLSEPLRWTRANPDELAMLKDLQANILKGHGRPHTAHLFLQFDPSNATQIKSFLRGLKVTSALSQLQESEKFKKTGKSGAPVTLCMLSAAGYKALGILAKAPPDPAFLAGIQARQYLLNDPPPKKWDRHFRVPVHAMVVLADADAARVRRARHAFLASLPAGAGLTGEEVGARLESLLSPGEAIEHFGYVDGRSNPLLLEEDIERESRYRGGISTWNPQLGLNGVLVRDPATAAATSFGSYVVFRKLEQDVKAFKLNERKLATALHLTGNDKKRAGAMVIGRFEDGTPLSLRNRDGMNNPVPNNFDYAGDPLGSKCPVHGHMRKVNPRGEGVQPGGAKLQEERSHALVRRGITYGKRSRHPNSEALNIADMPSKGVGLLFMAYQSNIEDQFEFIQSKWANNPRHLRPGLTGIDPLIGSGPDGERAPKAVQVWPTVWGDEARTAWKAYDFQGYVKMLGGEYFFSPSITTLRTL